MTPNEVGSSSTPSSNVTIAIPSVDFRTAQWLEAVLAALEPALRQSQQTINEINATYTAASTAVSFIVEHSAGQTVNALSGSFLLGVRQDGIKVRDALIQVNTALKSFKGTILEYLPAIRAGLSAMQTAQIDQYQSMPLDQQTASLLQGQLNAMLAALTALSASAERVNREISILPIGGMCSIGGTGEVVFEKGGDAGSTTGKNDKQKYEGLIVAAGVLLPGLLPLALIVLVGYLSGGLEAPGSPPTEKPSEKPSDGWTETVQQLENGQTQATFTEPDGTKLEITTPKGASVGFFANSDGSHSIVVTTQNGTTITTVAPDGSSTVKKSTAPPGGGTAGPSPSP